VAAAAEWAGRVLLGEHIDEHHASVLKCLGYQGLHVPGKEISHRSHLSILPQGIIEWSSGRGISVDVPEATPATRTGLQDHQVVAVDDLTLVLLAELARQPAG
jgi:hypothetical protein